MTAPEKEMQTRAAIAQFFSDLATARKLFHSRKYRLLVEAKELPFIRRHFQEHVPEHSAEYDGLDLESKIADLALLMSELRRQAARRRRRAGL